MTILNYHSFVLGQIEMVTMKQIKRAQLRRNCCCFFLCFFYETEKEKKFSRVTNILYLLLTYITD